MLKIFGFDPIAVTIVLLVAMPAVSVYAGFAEAYSKREFFVYHRGNKEESYIILAIQNGIIVSALYNAERAGYERIFFVKEITDEDIARDIAYYSRDSEGGYYTKATLKAAAPSASNKV